MRAYISRPSASKPSAFRIAAAASPEIVFSFRIRLHSLLNRRIRPSLSVVETAGNFPVSSSRRAISRMSSMCFRSMSARRANVRLAIGSAAFEAASS